MMTIFIITHFFDFFLKTISDRTHKYTQTQIQKYKYDPEDILASATSSQGYDCSGPTQTGPTSSTDSQNIGRGPADYTIGSEIRKYVYTQIRIHEMYLCIDANTVRPKSKKLWFFNVGRMCLKASRWLWLPLVGYVLVHFDVWLALVLLKRCPGEVSFGAFSLSQPEAQNLQILGFSQSDMSGTAPDGFCWLKSGL